MTGLYGARRSSGLPRLRSARGAPRRPAPRGQPPRPGTGRRWRSSWSWPSAAR